MPECKHWDIERKDGDREEINYHPHDLHSTGLRKGKGTIDHSRLIRKIMTWSPYIPANMMIEISGKTSDVIPESKLEETPAYMRYPR